MKLRTVETVETGLHVSTVSTRWKNSAKKPGRVSHSSHSPTADIVMKKKTQQRLLAGLSKMD